MESRERKAMSHSIGKNYWKTIVFTFCLGWTVIWIYRSMLSPVYPAIQGSIGEQTKAAMGLISSCYFFGYTAMQIPSGALVDRFGQKRVLIPGFLIFALGAFLISRATTLTAIYVGSVMAGVGCGCYYGSAFSLTAEHVPPEKKGLSTAIVNSGSALGMIIGMTLSSYLVNSLGFPWQLMVTISTALILLLVVWYAVALHDNMADKRKLRSSDAAPDVEAGQDDIVTEVSSARKEGLWSIRSVACYALYFATCYSYYMIVTWLPNFLQTERGIEGGLVGLVVSMISVTAIPGALWFSHLSDKRRNRKANIILLLEIAAFFLVAVSMLAPNALVLAAILLLYGLLGKMAVDPVLISYITDHAEAKNTATTLGTFNFFGMASSVVAPWFTGVIMDMTGSGELGFYLGAVLLLAGTALFFFTNVVVGERAHRPPSH
ncbi:MFS transporter [Olsenella profusa]|nr:MFS transporter [Olsenella profusa]